jgi:hypothetical protein
MKIVTNIVSIIVAVLVLSSCTKQDTDPLMDARPDVPVNFTNASDYRPDPTVICSLKDSIITISLEIPAQSGRTITQISKIATSTSYTKIQGSTGLYVSTPIPVNGTSYTYKTSIKEYYSKNASTGKTGANPDPVANVELANKYYFSVKLDDGTDLITLPVRILILP